MSVNSTVASQRSVVSRAGSARRGRAEADDGLDDALGVALEEHVIVARQLQIHRVGAGGRPGSGRWRTLTARSPRR